MQLNLHYSRKIVTGEQSSNEHATAPRALMAISEHFPFTGGEKPWTEI